MSRLLALAVAVSLGACALVGAPPGSSIAGRSTPPSARIKAASSLPNFEHVVVLVMENKEYGQVIGSKAAPYTNKLAKTYGLATRFYAASHPSLPNYLALIGGSTFGRHSDCTSCLVSATNLVDQLEAKGISWKGYMQNMPKACYTGPYYGLYAKKHNPFVYFKDIVGNKARCANVVPYTQLAGALKKKTLPRFSFITPNVCNDTHDCSVATGDRYLSGIVPKILSALGTNGVLFLTYDEGYSSAGCCTYAAGGHIATIVAGPSVKPGTVSSTRFDLYSILKTVETAWGLSQLRRAGCSCTRVMSPFF